MEHASTWPIIATVVGFFASLVGGLVIYNLQSLKRCISTISSKQTHQDNRLANIERDMNLCKVDCSDKFVAKEDWVRAEGYTRQILEKQTATLNRMDGKLDIVQQLPVICGNIAKSISAEFHKEARS